MERICVAIGALNLKAGRPGTPIFQQKILQDTNMELMFEMHSHDPTHEFPEIKVCCCCCCCFYNIRSYIPNIPFISREK